MLPCQKECFQLFFSENTPSFNFLFRFHHSIIEENTIPCKLHNYFFLLRSIIIQKMTATAVLTVVAAIPAPTTAVGFTLPY